MNKEQFWNIVNEVHSSTDPRNQKEVLAALRNRLRNLSSEEILEWKQIFSFYQDAARRNDLWAASTAMGAHSSDDGFIDFRSWLISQGRDVYMSALKDPESLVSVNTNGQELNFEDYAYVPYRAYAAWQELYEQVCRDYDEKPRERLPLSQQKEFKPVRNMVIRETMQWMAMWQRFAENNPDRADGNTPNEISSTDDMPDGTSSGDTESDAPPRSSSELPFGWEWKDHETAQPARVRSAAASEYYEPTVGEAVVRMLHHMSRIFEDNSKLDQIHRGLQIDRKRRRELQRKRLAMGHKADDHEEQTFK